MSATDSGKAFFEFWTSQYKAVVQAQEQTAKAFAANLQMPAFGKTSPIDGASSANLPSTFADFERANHALSELWSAATSMSQTMITSLPLASNGDKTVETTFRKMFDPQTWMGGTGGGLDDMLGRMAEGPRLADLWEIERLYARVLAAWVTVRRFSVEHNSVVLEAWVEAGRRFKEELAATGGMESQEVDAKRAMALWTDTANRQLLETQRSDAFLQSQAAMIRASTDLRMAQQELVEHFGKQYGFPTRTELDDVHRTLTELRREVRAMRRQQRVASPGIPVEQASH